MFAEKRAECSPGGEQFARRATNMGIDKQQN
jgi:hypothetical protein